MCSFFNYLLCSIVSIVVSFFVLFRDGLIFSFVSYCVYCGLRIGKVIK
jgi:hypothetical protein